MLPKYHIFFGLIFSTIIFLLFTQIGLIGFLIIFLSSFLIDVDHYLFFVYAKKDIILKNAHRWFIEKNRKSLKLSKAEKKKIKAIPCIFHGIEMILVLIILSFFSQIFLYVLVGFIFHELLDLISLKYNGFNFHHIGSQT